MPLNDRREELNRKARLAFVQGASEQWQRVNGRPPSEEELNRIIKRYPGDPMPVNQ
jgi:hypothetical protein